MTKQVRVNIRAVANAAAVRKEKRNGRDVVIVPSATLPDDIIMNGSQGKVFYPADEIAKAYRQLERTPAPLGHPVVNGKFVSARDPEGINLGHIGAWNENVRQEKGADGRNRVLLDKVIDVEVANRSQGGKAVLAAIEAGGPVHTSTGLLCMLEPVANNASYSKIARSYSFDHDAILLNEEGAATPEQGVGMLVNANGEQEEIEVINSALSEADRDLDWAVDSLARALEKRERAPMLERLKSAIIDAFNGFGREPSLNTQENDMAVSEEQFNALSEKVNALSEALKPETLATAIGNAVQAAVKPLTDAQAELTANQKAKDDAELTELRAKIVKANLLNEAEAGELTLNAARGLAKQAEPKKAAGLNGATATVSNESGFKLPKSEAK